MRFNHKCRLPALRVHSWGGFGSQLNALALLLHLKLKYPNREFELIVHTSGITRRDLEISTLVPPWIKVSVIDDFQTGVKRHSNKPSLKSFFIKALIFMNLITRPNDDQSFSNIKIWTISARGHYSQIQHPPAVFQELSKLLDISPSNVRSDENVVHYRLGDLLSLDKGFIKPESLSQIINSLSNRKWLVLSDSPRSARNLLNQNGCVIKSGEYKQLQSIDVIQKGVGASVFIGTNSKISIWISLFRIKFGERETYLPLTLQEALNSIIGTVHNDVLKFYQ